MTCDVCKTNTATVYLTQIVDGNMKKINLCESCSKDKGVSDPTGFALADLLLGLGETQQVEQAPPTEHCPHCGFTQADFKKAGRLGCSECYVTFAEGLDGLLKSMHKGIKHIDKVPEPLRQSRDLTEKFRTLQKRLEKAISEEDF